MRRVSNVALVALLLLQTMALGLSDPVLAGGTNDDFFVTGISIDGPDGNMSTWVQSDGTTVEYVFELSQIEISMSIQRGGNQQIAKATTATMEVIHPIGFVMETFSWTSGELTGGMGASKSFLWTPSAAHSILNTTTNDLSGGLILRATVSYPGDDRNDNDQMEQSVPVAIAKDIFDGWAGPSQLTFLSARYPVGGGDATGTGSWEDDAGAAVGTKHWRHSAPGGSSDYPSNANDRLVNIYQGDSQGQCGPEGQLDASLINIYGAYYCKKQFYSSNYISSQFHIQAWGSMAAGDNVSIELWNGQGDISSSTQSVRWNIANGNPSPVADQWSNLSWDPQVTWKQQNPTFNSVFLGGNSYSMGMLFNSDTSGASEGFHVDDWIQFGVTKVSDYTLELDCDNPSGGYSGPPLGLMQLKCDITNNGYSTALVRVETNVTNASWMSPQMPMLRIDVAESTDHDFNVLMPAIPGGATREVYVNLSIPAGADVQQVIWEVWFTDASSSSTGEKGRLTMDVAVSEQFGVSLTSAVSLNAGDIGPGESIAVPFRLQNSGNKDAAFNLATTFSEDGWLALIENETGVSQSLPITLNRGEYDNYILNITAPSDASPGTVSFNLRATCGSCGALFGNDVLVRNLEVPVFRQVSLESDIISVEGAANGVMKKVYITILNHGNNDEIYNYSLTQTNWYLGAEITAAQSPVMDAWDGESTIILNLPMPIGLTPGLYGTTVFATNSVDNSVKSQITISVEILDTAAVWISNEDAEQSYIPGDPAQTMAFEVRNDGNNPDRFTMSLDIPEGMIAEFTGLMDGVTTEIETGASVNVSVRFSFIEGTDGERTLGVIATSVSDQNVSARGEAIYSVGSLGWLRIIYNQPPLQILDSEEDYTITVSVRNQYTDSQSVAMELDNGESGSWFQARIQNSDRGFVLAAGEERSVTITFDISETTLLNLDSDTLSTNLTLWARSETVSDAANYNLQVILTKTDSTSDSDVSGGSSTFDFQNILIWIVFIVIMGVGGVFLKNQIFVEEEEDDYGGWGEEGYEESLHSTYGSVASAPTVTSQGVFSAPDPVKEVPAVAPVAEVPAAPAPVAEVPAAPAPVAEVPAAAGTSATHITYNITQNIQDSVMSDLAIGSNPIVAPEIDTQAPPVPAEGLPDGWSMEQWEAYGQMWLEQNGRA
jgi:uncharacterized membrane protein